MLRRILAGLFVAVAIASGALAGPLFPALTGRVVDQAGLLPAGAIASITMKLKTLEDQTTDQFVVATVKSLQGYDIQDYGARLGNTWGIGQKDKNNGVILLVAPNERKVGIEVGDGLRGSLTDALAQAIIQTGILPHFRTNDMAGGIESGVDGIVHVLSGDVKDSEKSPAP